MKKSRFKAAFAITGSIVALAAIILIAFFVFQKSQEKLLISKLSEKDIKLSAIFTVTAETGCMETAVNSYVSAKAGINSGAQAISADISFTKDGVPVLASKYADIRDEPVTLESIFKLLADKKEVAMILDLKEATNLPEIENLAQKYELTKRIVYSGVNKNQVSYIQTESPDIPFYLDISPDIHMLSNTDYCLSLVETAYSLGAAGVNCPVRLCSKTLVETAKTLEFKISVYDVEKEADMYRTLDFEVDNITTKNPDLLLKIVKKLRDKAAMH